jgi:hypothetical protein
MSVCYSNAYDGCMGRKEEPVWLVAERMLN